MGRLTTVEMGEITPLSGPARNIRFTATYVRGVADLVETLTDGLFSMAEIGRDLGSGTRYIDAHDSTLVWTGEDGGRCAAAYYVGGAKEWFQIHRHTLFLEWGPERVLHEVSHAVYRQAKYREWMDRGAERARVARPGQ
jgi:hypothetical protein